MVYSVDEISIPPQDFPGKADSEQGIDDQIVARKAGIIRENLSAAATKDLLFHLALFSHAGMCSEEEDICPNPLIHQKPCSGKSVPAIVAASAQHKYVLRMKMFHRCVSDSERGPLHQDSGRDPI